MKQEEDNIINEVLDEIWNKFNDDNNDILDKREMARFIYITLIESGQRNYHTVEDCFNDKMFNMIFQQFDEDGDGTVSRDELKTFIQGLK